MEPITLMLALGAGVLFLLCLADELKRREAGGVPNRKLSAHFLEPFPYGFYSKGVRKRTALDNATTWIFALSLLALIGIMLFRAEAFEMSVLYLIFGVVAMIIGALDKLFPKRTRAFTDVPMSGYNVTYPTLVLLGLVIGGVFAPLLLSLKIEPFSIRMGLSGAISLISTGFLIPIIEEAVFSNTMGASFIERGGIFFGVLGLVTVWVVFHIPSWGGLTIADIAFLASFRVTCSIPIIKYKSALPAWIGHIIVNLVAGIVWLS